MGYKCLPLVFDVAGVDGGASFYIPAGEGGGAFQCQTPEWPGYIPSTRMSKTYNSFWIIHPDLSQYSSIRVRVRVGATAETQEEENCRVTFYIKTNLYTDIQT